MACCFRTQTYQTKSINSLRPSSDAYICVSNATITWSALDHYIHQCRNIVYSNPRNNCIEILSETSYTFIEEYPFENVVWKMAAISSRLQCVNWNQLKYLHGNHSRRASDSIAPYVHNWCYAPGHVGRLRLSKINVIQCGTVVVLNTYITFEHCS